jgi:hypothetical protein
VKRAIKTETSQWVVYRFAAKPKFVGTVEARDEKEALKKAFAEFNIPEHERFKITVRRD